MTLRQRRELTLLLGVDTAIVVNGGNVDVWLSCKNPDPNQQRHLSDSDTYKQREKARRCVDETI